jgi:hypothetical protein
MFAGCAGHSNEMNYPAASSGVSKARQKHEIISKQASGYETRGAINKIAAGIYSGSNVQEPLPPHAFKSDGCSCFPDGDWVECCIKHDLVYWRGGTRKERLNADGELKKCVSDKGYPITAFFMYYGVRAGGVWWLPTSFRWGFGWNYPQSGPPDKPY